jgi:hypothetical protein
MKNLLVILLAMFVCLSVVGCKEEQTEFDQYHISYLLKFDHVRYLDGALSGELKKVEKILIADGFNVNPPNDDNCLYFTKNATCSDNDLCLFNVRLYPLGDGIVVILSAYRKTAGLDYKPVPTIYSVPYEELKRSVDSTIKYVFNERIEVIK